MPIDILICSLPSGSLQRPPAAPALLKSCVEQHGFTSVTRDLSLDLFINQCNRDTEKYSNVVRSFETLIEFDSNLKEIQLWIDDFIKLVNSLQPKCIGFSVFSNYQHRATVILSKIIRKNFPNIKILMGGMGLDYTVAESFKNFPFSKKIDLFNKFYVFVQKEKLADKLVMGVNGETDIIYSLCELFDTKIDLTNFSIPPSNFDDYLLDEYLWHDEKLLTITGSKGCVRSCTFCNIPSQFGRYQRRSGADIAKEMIFLKERYNIRKFEFTDSLINGSQKDFVEMAKHLAEYNDNFLKEEKINWFGQYICRPQSQIKKGTYELLKRAGMSNVIIGVESGSNNVLKHMEKMMTIEDVYDELEQLEKHQLSATLLIMVGYVNETREDFFQTLEFIINCHRYCANGTVKTISVGPTLFVNPGTPLFDRAHELGIEPDLKSRYNWKSKLNPENTFLERIQRKLVIEEIISSMGLEPTMSHIYEWPFLLEFIKSHEQQLINPDSEQVFNIPNLPHD